MVYDLKKMVVRKPTPSAVTTVSTLLDALISSQPKNVSRLLCPNISSGHFQAQAVVQVRRQVILFLSRRSRIFSILYEPKILASRRIWIPPVFACRFLCNKDVCCCVGKLVIYSVSRTCNLSSLLEVSLCHSSPGGGA